LTARAAAGPSGALVVRAVSSRPRLYYRLDAPLDSTGRFVWEPTIVAGSQVRLEPHEFKAIVCVASCDVPEPKLVAVSISDGPLPATRGVTLTLRSSLDLKQLFLTITRVGQKSPSLDQDVLQGRQLPAGAARDEFVELKRGQYSIRAVAVPSGSNAIDEVRATLIVP
jgi:hypothetical protein